MIDEFSIKDQREKNFTPDQNWEKVGNKIKSIFKKKIKKILFIGLPQFQTSKFNREMFLNKRYFNYPPYGIGLLKAAVEKLSKDIEIDILDLNHKILMKAEEYFHRKNTHTNNDHQQERERETFEVPKVVEKILVDYVKKFNPDLVGISCMFTMTHNRMLDVAKIVKEILPLTCVFAGGVHPTSSANLVLKECKNIDFINLFEGDLSLPALINFVNNSESNPRTLRQIAIIVNDEYLELQNRVNPSGEIINVKPSYGRLDIGKYSSLGEIGAYRFWWKKNTIASTSLSNRGCRARCSFCSVRNFNGKEVRGKTYESVIDELLYLKEYHGVNHIMWLDDDLLFDRERTIKMFNEMVRRNLNITWDASNGIIASALKDEVLDAAAESGCIGLHFGIESGNDQILKQVHKPSGKKHYLALEEKLKKYPQIFSKGFLMIGFPNETLEQIKETIDMAVKINLDWYTIQVVHPLPQTEMHQKLVEMGLITEEEVDAEKLNYGNRNGKMRDKEQKDIGNFTDPFVGDLKRIPKKEEMEDIWFTCDYKINYERINEITNITKLNKLLVFLNYISTNISTENPLVEYYKKVCSEKLEQRTLSSKSSIINNEYISNFWKKRLNILMKDTYDLL